MPQPTVFFAYNQQDDPKKNELWSHFLPACSVPSIPIASLFLLLNAGEDSPRPRRRYAGCPNSGVLHQKVGLGWLSM